MFMRILNIASLFGFALLVTACARQTTDYDIPNVAVDRYIYLNNPENFNLTVQGGWVYTNGGYRGLVIYRRYFNFDNNDFVAYERACPVHWADDCGKLNVENGATLQCQCDQAEFVLFDGTPIDQASQSVKFYRTTFDGGNVIHVVN